MRMVEIEFTSKEDYEKAVDLSIAINEANPRPPRTTRLVIAECGSQADTLLEKLGAGRIEFQLKRDQEYAPEQLGYESEF